jgi:thiazole synthase ThiGH ThiG subunit
MTTASNQETEDHRLSVGARTFGSRLLVGTGKYADLAQARAAIDASGAELVTLAVRRANLGQDPDAPNLLDYLPPERFTLLPNTAGCYSAREAVRTCELARELLGGHNLVKLEVIGDERTLYPDVPATLAATEQLVAAGFEVMASCGPGRPGPRRAGNSSGPCRDRGRVGGGGGRRRPAPRGRSGRWRWPRRRDRGRGRKTPGT